MLGGLCVVMKWRRWAELSVKSTLRFCGSAPRGRSSSSSELCIFRRVLESRGHRSSSTVMAEEAKKLAAYTAVDNHIQVGVYVCG